MNDDARLESLRLDADCPDDGTWLPMWTYDQDGVETFAGPGHSFHQRIAVLDVDGIRVLIEAWTFTGNSMQDLQDSERVFDSIDFE